MCFNSVLAFSLVMNKMPKNVKTLKSADSSTNITLTCFKLKRSVKRGIGKLTAERAEVTHRTLSYNLLQFNKQVHRRILSTGISPEMKHPHLRMPGKLTLNRSETYLMPSYRELL